MASHHVVCQDRAPVCHIRALSDPFAYHLDFVRLHPSITAVYTHFEAQNNQRTLFTAVDTRRDAFVCLAEKFLYLSALPGPGASVPTSRHNSAIG